MRRLTCRHDLARFVEAVAHEAGQTGTGSSPQTKAARGLALGNIVPSKRKGAAKDCRGILELIANV